MKRPLNNIYNIKVLCKNNRYWFFFLFKICVEDILNLSGKGSMILSFYQKNLRLNEELRKMLSEIIIEYMVQNKVYASPKIIEYISDGIVNIFKSEVKVRFYNLRSLI